jgi:hypothetical protein
MDSSPQVVSGRRIAVENSALRLMSGFLDDRHAAGYPPFSSRGAGQDDSERSGGTGRASAPIRAPAWRARYVQPLGRDLATAYGADQPGKGEVMERRFNQAQEWLYVIIVASLAAYLVIGVLAWTWMLLAGIAAPDAFTTIIATIAGGLVGIVTPLRGPVNTGEAPAPPSPNAVDSAP